MGIPTVKDMPFSNIDRFMPYIKEGDRINPNNNKWLTNIIPNYANSDKFNENPLLENNELSISGSDVYKMDSNQVNIDLINTDSIKLQSNNKSYNSDFNTSEFSCSSEFIVNLDGNNLI